MAIYMAVKMTFTLDEKTAREINSIAARLSKPKSQVIREAVHEFNLKTDRLTESERQRMVRALKEIMSRPPTRTQAEVDRELRDIRRSRRTGWSRPSDLR